MSTTTLEQRRMQRGFDALHRLDAKQRETWKRAVDGLGAEIQRCGLLQALAFVHRGPTRQVAEHLCEQIRQHLVVHKHLPNSRSGESLLHIIRDLERDAYLRVTREILALSVWLKRAVQIAPQTSASQGGR